MTVANRSASPTLASRMSGVWNAPPTLSGVTRLTPSSFARGGRGVEPVGRTGDHDLARRVVVRDPARVRCRCARPSACSSVAAEQRGHPAGVRVGGGLRELGAAGGEADAVVEGETPAAIKRGDLSERVTGEGDRRFDEWLQSRPTRRAT